MTSPNSSLGNVFSRLQGLKNVSGRRKVMPGAEFLNDLEPPPTDVEGTSTPLPNFANFMPTVPNQPENDLGGELTPQSYDVRANSVEQPTPQDQSQPGFWSKVGSALADYVNPQKRQQDLQSREDLRNTSQQSLAQTPPIETAQVDVQENLPPITASQQIPLRYQPPQASPGIMGAISDYFNPTKNDQMNAYNKDLVQDAQLRTQGKDPNQVRREIDQNQNLTHDQRRAIENPGMYAAYGSAQQVGSHPALQAEFKKITGIDYEPQIAAQITQHEAAMKGVEDALNGLHTQLDSQAEGIRQRILDNQSTDMDKYYIGLALLMPLLVGGIFGTQAGLGALSGGAQGFANVLQGRQKMLREDEESLLDISKQQTSNQEKLANLALEKAKLGPTIRSSMPDDSNSNLIGMQEATWIDPATGQEQRGIRVKPGLVARPEYLNSEDAIKDMRKNANDISAIKTYVDDVNSLTQDISDIVNQLDDKSDFNKLFIAKLSGTVPGVLSKLTQDVMYQGRKINAGVILEEKLGFLANKYGMAQQLGQLDRAAQSHIKKIMDNPTSTLLTPDDTLTQMSEIRKLAQQGLINQASNAGFYPEFLLENLEEKNNQFAGGLNKRSQKQRISEIEKKLSQNEINYAQ